MVNPTACKRKQFPPASAAWRSAALWKGTGSVLQAVGNNGRRGMIVSRRLNHRRQNSAYVHTATSAGSRKGACGFWFGNRLFTTEAQRTQRRAGQGEWNHE